MIAGRAGRQKQISIDISCCVCVKPVFPSKTERNISKLNLVKRLRAVQVPSVYINLNVQVPAGQIAHQ